MKTYKNIQYNPETGIISTKNHPHGNNIRADGYIRYRVDGIDILAHRLAFLCMTGKLPTSEVDHKNGIRHDNRWCNLRDVDHTTNMQNCKKYSNNTSGHVGVTYHTQSGKYMAQIEFRVNGKRRSVRVPCDTLKEAVNERQKLVATYRTGATIKR